MEAEGWRALRLLLRRRNSSRTPSSGLPKPIAFRIPLRARVLGRRPRPGEDERDNRLHIRHEEPARGLVGRGLRREQWWVRLAARHQQLRGGQRAHLGQVKLWQRLEQMAEGGVRAFRIPKGWRHLRSRRQ